FTVLNAFLQLLEGAAVTGHQSYSHLQVLLRRCFRELEHPPGSRAVRRQRLFHEDIQVFLNGISEMHPAKRQRRRENRDVSGLEAVHRLLITVEPDELAL